MNAHDAVEHDAGPDRRPPSRRHDDGGGHQTDDGEERQHPRQRVEDRQVAARLGEPLGVDDVDRGGHRRDVHAVEEGEPGADELGLHLLHHDAEVELHLALVERDRAMCLARVVGEQRDELVVRSSVRAVPQLLELAGREQLLGHVGRVAPHRGGDGLTEELGPLRQRVLDALGGVRPLEQRVDHHGGDGLLDVLVPGERRHRLDIAIRVGELVVRPDRDRRQRHQDESDDQEDDREDPLPPLGAPRPAGDHVGPARGVGGLDGFGIGHAATSSCRLR